MDARKALIVVGVVLGLLVALPVAVAGATNSEALQDLVETYKAIAKIHVKTLEKVIEAYKAFLGAI